MPNTKINLVLSMTGIDFCLFQAFQSNIKWKDRHQLPALQLTTKQLFFVAFTQVEIVLIDPSKMKPSGII
jgi:hypothetical protein